MKNTERREYNKKVKRAMIFIGIFAVFALPISAIMAIYNIPAWLNGMIVVIMASVFYLVFYFICVKIDKKKEEKTKEALKKKDPFAQ